ncbi:MFS transporter [Streptomyces tubercidicus]|uniref:MFS transporter n=1 Tax=Streptomyces tubercidicus TaxID=47759 RepID=UPI002E184319|nr:MFS transporter [Streptomyces tubercidicus]
MAPTATTQEPQPTPHTLTKGTLIACCLAVCVAQIGLVLPASLNGLMQQSLKLDGSQLVWVSAAFFLPTATLGLTFGVVGDLFGRKRMLVGGAALMALGCTLAATAHSATPLFIGQATSGLGAAALFPSSLALLTAAAPEPQARARVLAAWTASLTTGAFAAPLISGVSGEQGSFRLAFAVVSAIAVASAVVSLLGSGDSCAPEGRALDWGGQITIAGGLLVLLYAVIEGPNYGWASPRTVAGFVLAAVLIAAFLRIESRTTAPMLRLDLFKIPRIWASAVVAVIGMFGFIGSGYSLSIRVGVIQHQSPMASALPFMVIAAVTPVVSFALARLLERFSPRLVLVIGFAVMAAGQFWLAVLPITQTSLLAMLPALLLNGLGFGFAVSGLTAATVNSVPIELAGMASASTSLIQQIGQTFGAAIISTVALSSSASALAQGLPPLGLAPDHLNAVHQALAEGGPLAVLGAFGGTDHPVAQATVTALAHGFSVGQIICACASLTALTISALFIRPTAKAAQHTPAPPLAAAAPR